MLFYLFIGVLGFFFSLKALAGALPKFFLVPAQHWADKIQSVVDYPKPIYLKVGWKRSSYRRRLILASSNPSYYNNFNNNKLKICPDDIDIKDEFMARMKHRAIEDPRRKKLYGFFHPYANNGGGGEKVLWQAVHSTLVSNDNNIAVIYTVNYNQPLEITQKVSDKFNIDIDTKRVVFIYLRRFGKLIDNDYWKHFTLIGQIFGSVMVSLECMFELSPDIWIDSIGLPGSYLLVSNLLQIPILAYVHYPIIQEDMFKKLKFQKFKDLTTFKLGDWKVVIKFFYWNFMYYLYVYLGSLVDITLANGTWTHNHIKSIWFLNKRYGSTMEILYPPCATEYKNPYISTSIRTNKMIYIAQFRSEKRHDLILAEYVKFLESFKSKKAHLPNLPTIVFLGSCRTEDDTDHLNYIKQLVDELNLSDYVEFIVDCSYDEILKQLAEVKFGLNSMWNEHFGIGVVEYLANGVIPIVHGSAGPILDIVLNENSEPVSNWKSDSGFFFKSAQDPDFDHSIQSKESEYLTFNINDQSIEFPELSQLLIELFITNPLTEHTMETMKEIGNSLAKTNFSNESFNNSWRNHCRSLGALEERYRDEKRQGVEAVH